jgi:hypothetical protein
VIAGRVVAEATRVINDIIRSAVIVVQLNILIFFIFPARLMPKEEETDLNNNLDEKEKIGAP